MFLLISYLTNVSVPALGRGRYAHVSLRHLQLRIQVQVSMLHSHESWWGVCG